jgi:hypothetical protein
MHQPWLPKEGRMPSKTGTAEKIVPKSMDVYGHAAHGTTSGPAWQAAVQ